MEKDSVVELLQQRHDMLRLVKIQANTGGWAIALIVDAHYAFENHADDSLTSFLENYDVPPGKPDEQAAYSFKPVARQMLDDASFTRAFPRYATRLRALLDPQVWGDSES